MDLQLFEKEYTVHVYETGTDGRLNIFSLFNYMQDVASEHAVRLGFGRDDLLKNNHFWVLSRMYVVITEWPGWDRKIILKTWPNGTDKLFAMRNYLAEYPDGRQIASATSSWLIVDRTTRRIQRPGETLTLFARAFRPESSPVRKAEKLPGYDDNPKPSDIFRVKISDLDVNHHTNNANYLKWIYNTYGLDFVNNHYPCSAEINYLAESLFEDEIVIFTQNHGNHVFDHSVRRIADNKELCRIRIVWKESGDAAN